jgi:hypothetical protein
MRFDLNRLQYFHTINKQKRRLTGTSRTGDAFYFSQLIHNLMIY